MIMRLQQRRKVAKAPPAGFSEAKVKEMLSDFRQNVTVAIRATTPPPPPAPPSPSIIPPPPSPAEEPLDLSMTTGSSATVAADLSNTIIPPPTMFQGGAPLINLSGRNVIALSEPAAVKSDIPPVAFKITDLLVVETKTVQRNKKVANFNNCQFKSSPNNY